MRNYINTTIFWGIFYMFSICFLLNINDIYKGVIALIFMKQLRIIPVSGNEHFDINISGNAPQMIEDNLMHIVSEWLDKQGSTVYFTGKGPSPFSTIKGKKRKALLLKLKIVRGLQPAHPDYK